MIFKILYSLVLFSIIFQTSVSAGVFKCVKKNGDVYYNDKPCASGLKREKVRIDKKSKVAQDISPQVLDKKPYSNNLMNPEMILKQREEEILRIENGIDDGSYQTPDSDMALINKLNTFRQKQEEKSEQEYRRKEAIRKAQKEERERAAKIEHKKIMKKVQKSLANLEVKKRVADYKDLLKSKERSGAMMTEEERDWRNSDDATIAKKAQKNHELMTPGTKAYKDRQQSMRAAGYAKQRQIQFEKDFNKNPPLAQ